MSNSRPVIPSDVISPTANRWNALVPISPDGVPAFAISIESWRLHDVQLPQSAEPAKTTSHSFAISAISSCGAGVDALALRRWITCFTP